MRRMVWQALVLAFGIVASTGVADAADMTLRMVFSTPYSTNFTPYVVAKELGYFRELGLVLEESFVSGDANTTRAVIANSGDVGLTGPVNLFAAVENGARVKSIGAWQPIPDYDVVTRSDLQSMKDLADKTFAASGPSGLPQVLPIMMFKKLGIATGRVKFVSIGGHSARLQALIAGKADAALVNSITAVTALKRGGFHVITSVAKDFPQLGYQALVVRTADLADPARRKAYEALMNGSLRGARFTMKDPDKAAALMQARMADVDLESVRDVIKTLTAQKLWGVNGGLGREITDFTAKLAFEMGEIKTLMTHEQVMDDSINDAVIKQIGRF